MTSHYRHRRFYDPAVAFPSPVEPGEIAVNTANRQLAVGDANPASAGSQMPLLAVRFFDVRAQYAANDFVTLTGGFYRAKVGIVPGAFDATKWDSYSGDTVIKAYADAGDAAVTAAFQNADSTLTTTVSGKVNKAGDVMTGFLTLSAPPTSNLHAATKLYVDQQVAAGGLDIITALDVSYAPTGAVSSTNVQAAISELDVEKAALYSPAFIGAPTSITPPLNDNSTKIATTAFVAGQASSLAPAMDGTATIGISLRYSRDDHAHPTDTSRAPINSPQFGGIPTAPTAAAGNNSTQLATCEFVVANGVADGSVTYQKINASALATPQDFLASVIHKILTADKIWAAAAPVTLPSLATVAPDFNTGIDFILTLTGSVTLTNPLNPKLGQKGIIYLAQDGAGNRLIATWGSTYKFPGGVKPVLSTAAGAVDMLSYSVKSGTEIECSFQAGMA